MSTDANLFHTVAAGETLSGIAERLGLDWRDIAAVNGLANPDALQVGQVLRLPITAAGSAAPSQRFHTVAAGETLSGIAERLGLDWRDIAAVNGLANPDALEVGQTLRLPGTAAGSAAPSQRFHTVTAGETLFGIAERLGLDWRHIAAVNGLANPDTLQVGQVLRLTEGGFEFTRTAALLLVEDPLTKDGSAIVTSSSAEGHHCPFGGGCSADLDVTGPSRRYLRGRGHRAAGHLDPRRRVPANIQEPTTGEPATEASRATNAR